jgi:hypothetical protein
MTSSDKLQRVAGGAAVGFGLLTLVSGGTALLGAIDMGAVVPFVLWFNFLAGFAYVGAGVLLWRGNRLALWVSIALLAATVSVFGAFAAQALAGTPFEARTVGALILRTVFWVGFVMIAWRVFRAATVR